MTETKAHEFVDFCRRIMVVPKGKFAEHKLIWTTKLFSALLVIAGLQMFWGAVHLWYDSLFVFLAAIVFGFILIGFGAWFLVRLIQVTRVLPKSQIVNRKS